MPKQYFFEAGTFPDLSLAELSSVFKVYGLNTDCIHRYTDKLFIIKNNSITEEILSKIFNRLGGFVRYGYVIDNIETFLAEQIEKNGKITFGISILGTNNSQDNIFLRKLSGEIKDELKKSGISSRFVRPLNREIELNAAQVLKNDIVKKGFELCIMRNNQEEEIYGCTLNVQNIDEFSKRDFQKPYTDVVMGTLPPKLARIMINLTSFKGGIIWDPFCGSGTIPMEASVLGFDILGSDIDENALKYTEENIKWLSDAGQIGDIKYDIFPMDVKNPQPKVINKLKKTDISAVVCEPYMGPVQKRVMFPNRAEIFLKRVKELYDGLFDILDEIEHEGFVVVLIIPSYKTIKGWETIGIRDIVGKRWEVLNSQFPGSRDLKWSRKNSIITRNIFILRKK